MKKPAYFLYGVISQIITITSLVYFALWVYRIGVSKTIDSGTPGDPLVAFAVNTVLLAIFCSSHSILARTSVKKVMRRYVPHLLERATYCILFGLMVFGLCFAWRPLPAVVWRITSPGALTAIAAVFIGFWVMHFGSIFWMGYAEFFGLRQTWLAAHGEAYTQPPPMTQRDFAISHLLLIISLAALPWATPVMSVGQLYFALFLTVYDVIGAWFSAKDLSDVPAPVPDAAAATAELLPHP